MTPIRLRAHATTNASPQQAHWGVLALLEVAGPSAPLRDALSLVRGRTDSHLDVVLSAQRRTAVRDAFVAAALMSGASTVLPSCTAESLRLEEVRAVLAQEADVPWALWSTAEGLSGALTAFARQRCVSVAVAAPGRRRDRRSLAATRLALGPAVLLIDASVRGPA
ncbi:MAG TPA: hypothetical protein VHE83_07870 [Mycobacteriales bacterium]|nr:hypothetical protein [Mycobacteriales bacterium]